MFSYLTHFCLCWNSVLTANLKPKQITFGRAYFPVRRVGNTPVQSTLQLGTSAGFSLPGTLGCLRTVGMDGQCSWGCFLAISFPSPFLLKDPMLHWCSMLRTNAFQLRTLLWASHSFRIKKDSNTLKVQCAQQARSPWTHWESNHQSPVLESNKQ